MTEHTDHEPWNLPDHLQVDHDIDHIPNGITNLSLREWHQRLHTTMRQPHLHRQIADAAGEGLESKMTAIAGLEEPDMSVEAIAARLRTHDPYWATRALHNDVQALLSHLEKALEANRIDIGRLAEAHEEIEALNEQVSEVTRHALRKQERLDRQYGTIEQQREQKDVIRRLLATAEQEGGELREELDRTIELKEKAEQALVGWQKTSAEWKHQCQSAQQDRDRWKKIAEEKPPTIIVTAKQMDKIKKKGIPA